MLRLLVFGSRNWVWQSILWRVLDQELAQVEGGSDTLAKMWAEERQIDHLSYPARWREQGRSAGPQRNARMIREGRPDRAIGFHEDWSISRGSADMRDKLIDAGIDVQKKTIKLKKG